MDSNKVFATIKRYRTQFAMGALVLFTILTVGVIYFIRQSSEPIAPTAPTSRPGAIVAACTTDFMIQPECLDLEFNLIEEASSSAEVATGSADLKPGNRGTFVCEALPGTTSYKFEYKDSEDGDFEELSSGSETESDELTIGEYIEVRCIPCAGDYCASPTNVAQNCTLNATGRIIIPSPEPTPVPSPVPSPKPRTGFRIQKFNDLNGDGTRQDNEPGLAWEFEWRLEDDDDWEEYETDEDNDGRGEEIDDLEVGDVIVIREKTVSGWKNTTPVQRTLTMEGNEILIARFGNQKLPGSPTPGSPRPGSPLPGSPRPASSPVVSPQPEIPVSGSTTQTAGLLVVGLGVIALGFLQFYKRLRP